MFNCLNRSTRTTRATRSWIFHTNNPTPATWRILPTTWCARWSRCSCPTLASRWSTTASWWYAKSRISWRRYPAVSRWWRCRCSTTSPATATTCARSWCASSTYWRSTTRWSSASNSTRNCKCAVSRAKAEFPTRQCSSKYYAKVIPSTPS